MKLQSLRAEARRFVTPELASGELVLSSAELAGLVDELPRAIPLDAFDAAIDACLRTTRPHSARIDAAMAQAIHSTLGLTRREARDPGIWRWLAVAHRPDFVRHRWENRSWATTRTRYWTLGTRPESNAFARLYWIAELTCEGDDYELTDRVLARQPLATNLFVRRHLASHRPAIAACIRALEDRPAPVVEATLRALTRRLSTLLLEALDEDALFALASELRDRVEREG